MMNMYPFIRQVEQRAGLVVAFKTWAQLKRVQEANGWFGNTDRQQRIEEIRGKQRLRDRIAQMQEDGVLYVTTWSRDCDMCEGTSRAKIEGPDLFEAYMRFWEGMADDAEGSFSIRIVSKQEYDEFQRSTRDRALEAFEDGHPHVIYA